jgi:plastocyanin
LIGCNSNQDTPLLNPDVALPENLDPVQNLNDTVEQQVSVNASSFVDFEIYSTVAHPSEINVKVGQKVIWKNVDRIDEARNKPKRF